MDQNKIRYKLRYKVLRVPGRLSTGLLHSTTIKYKLRDWTYPAEPPQRGKAGPGGLWASRNRAQANRLQRYLRDRGIQTEIYVCIIDKILFESSYRTKTNRLFLIDRVG